MNSRVAAGERLEYTVRMRLRLAFSLAVVAIVVVLTGCPEDWGIEGTNDQAMVKDMKALLHEQCPAGMHRNPEPCTSNAPCKRCLPNQ